MVVQKKKSGSFFNFCAAHLRVRYRDEIPVFLIFDMVVGKCEDQPCAATFMPRFRRRRAAFTRDKAVLWQWNYGVWEGRINQYVVVNLHREFRYGVTTADEGLLPISPSKLKYPPHPSGRRY